MNRHLVFIWTFIVSVLAGAGIFAAQTMSPNAVISSTPVYKPDLSHVSDHLLDATLAWDATMKTTNVPATATSAHFTFYFTNIATRVDATLTTNITMKTYLVAKRNTGTPRSAMISPLTRTETVTNIAWVTNSIEPLPVTVVDVHPSCGCTTAQLPPLPWRLEPGTNSQIGITVNLAGKFGTIVKTVHVATDMGSRNLILQITILPPVAVKLTEADMMRQMAIAKADRQAVFKNDCASCHVAHGQYKYGKDLYDADCGICHEAEHRATMVPDLHHLKVATNADFWRTWIAHGKPGSFMPAFSTADGGPLNDMQIASLAAYLSATIPNAGPTFQ